MVITAHEKGWGQLQNGDLIESAEKEGFDLLVTTDKNLKYQQSLKNRKIGIVVLLSSNWPKIRSKAEGVAAAIGKASAGAYIEIAV